VDDNLTHVSTFNAASIEFIDFFASFESLDRVAIGTTKLYDADHLPLHRPTVRVRPLTEVYDGALL
jgi:hypothetical protein